MNPEVTKHITLEKRWFDYVKCGRKTIEGRKGTPENRLLQIGHTLELRNNDETINVRITDIRKYNSIEEYLENEGLEKTLPDVKNNGVDVYLNYWKIEDVVLYGVLAIHFEII